MTFSEFRVEPVFTLMDVMGLQTDKEMWAILLSEVLANFKNYVKGTESATFKGLSPLDKLMFTDFAKVDLKNENRSKQPEKPHLLHRLGMTLFIELRTKHQQGAIEKILKITDL